MEVLLMALLILLAKIVDVSLGTIRILLLMHGSRFYASFIGFFECLIFIFLLGTVVQHLDNPINLIFYSLGFSLGNYFGSFVEERIAIGHVTLQIISKNYSNYMADELRSKGFGVTIYHGYGKDETERNLLQVLLKRKNMPDLLEMVESIDKESFISIMDTKKIIGGYFCQRPMSSKLNFFRRKVCTPGKMANH